MFNLDPTYMAEGVYVIRAIRRPGENIPIPAWATYQIGCELCGFWMFEGKRWRAFWRLFRHRCRT
jgi:hypothetical protein